MSVIIYIKFFSPPKIEELLNDLEKAGKLIIITSNKTSLVKDVLLHHGVLPHLEIWGFDIEPSKTKKILSAKEKYGNAKYFYVGDTVGDTQEAKKAGVISVAVTYGYHKREWLEEIKPDFLVDTVDELRSVLLD